MKKEKMNKTTEALKLAEKTLEDIIRVYKFEGGTPVTALAAIREVLAEQEKQEPVAWVDAKEEGYEFYGISYLPVGKHHLYAAPVSAKREWVDLTDYEIGAVMDFGYATDSELENARDVIAAFKDKNK